MNASFDHVCTIEFGKCDQWSEDNAKHGRRVRTYSLYITDQKGEYHSIRFNCDRNDVIPTIDSAITDENLKPCGDWLTDSIDGISLELPPMPDESPATMPSDITARKLGDALRVIRDTVSKRPNYLSNENMNRLSVAADLTAHVLVCLD